MRLHAGTTCSELGNSQERGGEPGMGPLAHLSHSSHTLVTYLCIRSTSASPGATDRFLPQVHPPGASCPRAPGRPGMGFRGGAGGDLGAHSRGNPEGGGSYPQRILGRRVGGINTACPRVEHSGARGGEENGPCWGGSGQAEVRKAPWRR